MPKKRILSAHHFDSSDDYYEQFLESWELRANDIMENDPTEFLTDEQIDSIVYDHFEEVWDMLEEKGYVYDCVLKICKDEYECNMEL